MTEKHLLANVPNQVYVRLTTPAGRVQELKDDINMDQGLFVPLVLGIIEGLSEFLPVSSTAHLLLANYFFGLNQPAAFVVLIQLGAILAIVTVYFAKLFQLLKDAIKGKKGAWLFILNVVLASFPAALAGVMLGDFIQEVIYRSPLTISIMLIVGGIILLIVDRLPLQPKYTDIYTYPWHLSLIIGLFQMLALVPGVSRSGATIVGALLFGTDKRSAAEFTFFIALPIMSGPSPTIFSSRAIRYRRPWGFQSPSGLPPRLLSGPLWCAICLISSPGTGLLRSPGGASGWAAPRF